MKEVTLKNGKVVKTPWLRPDEAAVYCGVSRTFFDCASKPLPHGGNDRTRLYKISVLDAWINNEIEIPFSPLKEEQKPRKRQMKIKSTGSNVVVNPHNGRVFDLSL